MNILNDIEKIKAKLTKNAIRKGIHENFGQKERFELEKKYPEFENIKHINNFEIWAYDFNLNNIK